MSYKEYFDAQKKGKKEFRNRLVKGEYPYLPVLDDIISHVDIASEVNLGLVNVPLDQVVGTSTSGRTNAFAANFMPILDWGSEFSAKWAVLADAQVNEGIRDSIICYEFMNKFYVVEGNKRVSVMKYYDAVTIPAIVTRKVPVKNDSLENKLYYEFMDFYAVTGLNDVWFNYLGGFETLLDLVGTKPGEVWDEDEKMNFSSAFLAFKTAYYKKFEKKLYMTDAEALVIFLKIYGYKELCKMTADEIITSMNKSINEFYVSQKEEKLDLKMDPVDDEKKKNIFNNLLPFGTKNIKVAFVYDKKPEVSDWTYAHELGRLYLKNNYPDLIETSVVSHVDKTDNLEEILESLISVGNQIIFITSPEMMSAGLKVAIEHPEVKILNCSLNNPHGYVRTYYARMYEAKFLIGLIAGSCTRNDKVGYVADYPIYGMVANINAFALGAKMVNPDVQVYLAWSKLKDGPDPYQYMKDNDVHIVSGQELIVPNSDSRRFGCYGIHPDGTEENLAMSVWHWGVFYEKLIQSILSGSFKNEVAEEGKALNYWWGMSAGVIDVIMADRLPSGTKKLVNLMKKNICDGSLRPFSGIVRAQETTIKDQLDSEMNPYEIMNMDWLTNNVIGEIPPMTEFIDDAQELMEVQGVTLTKEKAKEELTEQKAEELKSEDTKTEE